MTRNFLLPIFMFLLLISACKTGPAPKQEVKYIYHHELRMPSDGITKETPTLLLLHGYGSNEMDLTSLGKYVHPEMLVVCPRAPITLEDGKYSWYPLNRFSQGAIMSLATGLTEPELLAGIISLSGELYPEVRAEMADKNRLKKTKLFVSHGLKDEVLFPGPMKKAVTDLKALGMEVEDHWYPVAHTISQDNFKDLLRWLLNEVEGT